MKDDAEDSDQTPRPAPACAVETLSFLPDRLWPWLPCLYAFEAGDEVKFASLNLSLAIADRYRDVHLKDDACEER